jgi:alpha-D-xyloside xylohydrolase
MLRPTIDTLAPTGQPDRVDSYATTPGVLFVRVFAGGQSDTVLFDGTRLGQQDQDSNLTLTIMPGDDFGQGAQFDVVAFGDSPPASVSDNSAILSQKSNLADLDEAQAGWFHTTEHHGRLVVKVTAGQHQIDIAR